MTSLMKTIVFNQRRVTASLLRLYTTSTEVPKFETLAVSEPKKHVFHVELNRPKKLNAFNHKMWLELKQCFESLSNNAACRVVVLSAKGKHFTAVYLFDTGGRWQCCFYLTQDVASFTKKDIEIGIGIDLNSFMEKASDASEYEEIARKVRFMYNLIGTYQDGITALEKCVKPVIAVSHSACVGAGVDLITAADMRYCTEDCWFQVKEVDIGLAADVGTLQRLPKVIGNTSVARELCFTARKLESSEAKELGLVSKVFKDKETALESVLEIAEAIASKSPVAVQTTKQSLVYSQNVTNDQGLAHIRLVNQSMLLSEDLSKAAVAAISKETAEFENF